MFTFFQPKEVSQDWHRLSVQYVGTTQGQLISSFDYRSTAIERK